MISYTVDVADADMPVLDREATRAGIRPAAYVQRILDAALLQIIQQHAEEDHTLRDLRYAVLSPTDQAAVDSILSKGVLSG